LPAVRSTSAKQVINRRRSGKTPRGDHRITNCTSQGGSWSEWNDGISIEVMHHIPPGVEEPSRTYEFVGAEPPVGAVGNQSGENKFPAAEASVEIGRACPGDHDGIEVPSVWLFEKRASTNVENAYQYRPYDIDGVKWRERIYAHLSFAFGAVDSTPRQQEQRTLTRPKRHKILAPR